MFDARDGSREWTEGSFWLQQFLVPLGSLLIGSVLMAWIAGLFPTQPPIMRVYSDAIGIIAVISGVFAAGYVMQEKRPESYGGGRLVWILPVFFFSLFLLFDLAQFRSVSQILHEYFYTRGGEEALGFFLFTWPTLSCCLYSAGVVVGRKRAALESQTKR
jgi:hypothetical protein